MPRTTRSTRAKARDLPIPSADTMVHRGIKLSKAQKLDLVTEEDLKQCHVYQYEEAQVKLMLAQAGATPEQIAAFTTKSRAAFLTLASGVEELRQKHQDETIDILEELGINPDAPVFLGSL